MKDGNGEGRLAQWSASAVAVLATLLTVGGPWMLAEHYASAGAGPVASIKSGYDVVEQSSNPASPPSRKLSAEANSPRHRNEKS